MTSIDFATLRACGGLDFYGVCNNTFQLGLGDTKLTYEAVEDPDDGYRSYLETIKCVDESGIYFRTPIAMVTIREADSNNYGRHFNGYQLVDVENGHVWLTIGTDNNDDYYPCFTFEYTPRPDQKV